MNQFRNIMQIFFTTISNWSSWFFGEWDGIFYALITFVVVDYITRLICTIIDRKFSSTVEIKNIFKKILIFILVGIGNILDTQVIGNGTVLRTIVILYYISLEGISLLENIGYLGLPFPTKLKTILEQLHDKSEENKEA